MLTLGVKILLYFTFNSFTLHTYFSRQSRRLLSPVEPLMKRVLTLVITVRIFTFSLRWNCGTDVHSSLHGTRRFVTLCRRMCKRALFLNTKIQCKISHSISAGLPCGLIFSYFPTKIFLHFYLNPAQQMFNIMILNKCLEKNRN